MRKKNCYRALQSFLILWDGERGLREVILIKGEDEVRSNFVVIELKSIYCKGNMSFNCVRDV